MELHINHNKPHLMHVDLNSCFATLTQQAYHNLRDKPLVIAAYDSPNGCIVAPSITAKRFGVKTGMTIREARLLCPDIIVRTPDPTLYRDAHMRFRKIFKDYTNDVTPKSIDEAILDFSDMMSTKLDLVKIGYEIKKRIKVEIGEYVTCNIGISTNMFLSKLAASLHKPDGLDTIEYHNLLDVYRGVTLLDLNGINTRFQARLNMAGIYTPMDFYHASKERLQKLVFKSVLGSRWYEKLRGYEADEKSYATKSIGQQYSIKNGTDNPKEIGRILMKLTEKMGRRLRRQGYTAQGIHVWCMYKDWSYWHRGRKGKTELYTTPELFRAAMLILNQQPEKKVISKIGVTAYDLAPYFSNQLTLFEEDFTKERLAADACDEINDRYGEFTIVPGIMMDMDDVVLDRIAFGGVKELEDLYTTSGSVFL